MIQLKHGRNGHSKKAGLSETQAEVYDCLLKNGAMTPMEISKKTGQSRENYYMVAKKLKPPTRVVLVSPE